MARTAYREFVEEREELNKLLLENANLETNRFGSLDSQVYRHGALPGKTKEMLGLVGSIVLRCDDCISYHLGRCAQEGVADEELGELGSVALVIGGSITIPHVRRAARTWLDIQNTHGGGAATRTNQQRPGSHKGHTGTDHLSQDQDASATDGEANRRVARVRCQPDTLGSSRVTFAPSPLGKTQQIAPPRYRFGYRAPRGQTASTRRDELEAIVESVVIDVAPLPLHLASLEIHRF
jgi:AhpD family alkylhydroperoxidase